MSLFSAKLSILSAISYTLDTWSVTADVIDNLGLFYAADAQVGDVIYMDNNNLNKYFVSEIASAAGARLLCKLTSLDTPPVAPTPGNGAVIGAVQNGVFALPARAAQGLRVAFTDAIATVENAAVSQKDTLAIASAIVLGG